MIEVKNLQYTYPGSRKPALQGLDFSVERGEVFGFLGPSGAGKSTAQKILYKVLKDFQGSVLVEGKDLQLWGQSYFTRIGVGFELPNHYLKLTGRENMQLFASFYSGVTLKNIEELFAMVQLEDAIDKTVETYSKGMKMRLNFIRAVQHDPEILFFDEPTAGLDPVNANNIRTLIQDLQKSGKTIFITTHSMHTADELCDRVSFIVNGKLAATDTPEKLKSQYGKDAVHVLLQNGSERDFKLEDLGANEQFISFLKEGEVKKIHTLEASLEEVFIRVTGETLRA